MDVDERHEDFDFDSLSYEVKNNISVRFKVNGEFSDPISFSDAMVFKTVENLISDVELSKDVLKDGIVIPMPYEVGGNVTIYILNKIIEYVKRFPERRVLHNDQDAKTPEEKKEIEEDGRIKLKLSAEEMDFFSKLEQEYPSLEEKFKDDIEKIKNDKKISPEEKDAKIKTIEEIRMKSRNTLAVLDFSSVCDERLYAESYGLVSTRYISLKLDELMTKKENIDVWDHGRVCQLFGLTLEEIDGDENLKNEVKAEQPWADPTLPRPLGPEKPFVPPPEEEDGEACAADP